MVLLALQFCQVEHPGESISLTDLVCGCSVSIEAKQSGSESVSRRHLLEALRVRHEVPRRAPVGLIEESGHWFGDSFATRVQLINMLLEHVVQLNPAQLGFELELRRLNPLRWVKDSLAHRLGHMDQTRVILVNIWRELGKNNLVRGIWIGRHWLVFGLHWHTWRHLSRSFLALHFTHFNKH